MPPRTIEQAEAAMVQSRCRVKMRHFHARQELVQLETRWIGYWSVPRASAGSFTFLGLLDAAAQLCWHAFIKPQM